MLFENALTQDNLKKLKIVYFLILAIVLFSVSYKPNPEYMGGDSQDYEGLGNRMTLSECFYQPTEDRELNPRDNDDRRIIISGRHKIGKCFFFMHRPFLLPLLIKMLGPELFNVFQNLVKVFAWVSLSFSVFLFNFRLATKIFLHGTVLIHYFNNLNYNNSLLSEDTTLSFWILSFSIFIKILYGKNSKKRIHLLLSSLNLCIFSLVFIRDSNFTLAVAYLSLVYLYIFIFFPKKNTLLSKRPIFLHLLISLFILASSNYSLNYTYRYEWTFRMNMDYHLGKEYWPRKVTTNVYQTGDREWFFKNYPEIKELGAHTTPYLMWQTKNIKTVWIHYVLTHLSFFFKLVFGFLKSNFLHPILTAFMLFMLLVSLFRIKKSSRFLFLFAGMFSVVFLDHFIALIGDAPGSLNRHANVSFKLVQFSYTFLCIFGLNTLIELLKVTLNFFSNQIRVLRNDLNSTARQDKNIPFEINESEPIFYTKPPGFSFKYNALAPGICEGLGLIAIGIFAWGTVIDSLYYFQGIDNYYNKHYTQMISDLDKSLFIRKLIGKPKEQIANVYHWKAQGNLNLEQNDQAILNFSKATEFNPNSSINFLNLGRLYQNLGQHEIAIENYTKAIQNRPDLSDAYRNRGLLYLNLNKLEEAYKDFSITIQIVPNDFLSYLNRAKILIDVKQIELAYQDLNKIIEYQNNLSSSNIEPAKVNWFKGEAYNIRGHLSQIEGKSDYAIEDFTKAIKFNPNNILTYFNRSKLLIAEKEYERALQDLDKVLALKNDVAEAYDLRGYVYLIGLQKQIDACQNFKRACELGVCKNFETAQSNKVCP
ncbi:MAG: tetratricopeptide repeat protein [SAR324 cluster bacterium]|nr:tetratricopeptide repeat protein [SAR324 cluster bacterium]